MWNSEAAEASMQDLSELYDRYKFHPTDIFAGYETSKIIANTKRNKKVISIADATRGLLVQYTNAW